jgi:hypothetical protein
MTNSIVSAFWKGFRKPLEPLKAPGEIKVEIDDLKTVREKVEKAESRQPMALKPAFRFTPGAADLESDASNRVRDKR